MNNWLKIQKVLVVVMFPVFMHNAPAAWRFNCFLTNSTLGILESKVDPLARRQRANWSAKPTTGHKPGFFQRLRNAPKTQHPQPNSSGCSEKQKGRRG